MHNYHIAVQVGVALAESTLLEEGFDFLHAARINAMLHQVISYTL